ncbi:MAG: hypothetical protein JJV97_01505 [SAR324 cluster bacterium]|nr:hypothetical protein [SAR324 cluster bacterium]
MLRKLLDRLYPLVRGVMFWFTAKDPEKAHQLIEIIAFQIAKYKIGRFLQVKRKTPALFSLSLAAGFDKNAAFPADFYHWLGVNRIVIGSVTVKQWIGNSRPRVARFKSDKTLLNWMGLPNDGVVKVMGNLKQKNHYLPVTLSVATSPDLHDYRQAELDEFKQLLSFIETANDIDRIEINLSCPNVADNNMANNTKGGYGEHITNILTLCKEHNKLGRLIFLKISPDLEDYQLADLLKIADKFGIDGLVISNTTTNHSFKAGNNTNLKGGASGDFVYLASQRLLKKVIAEYGQRFKIILCGGLSSVYKFEQAIKMGINDFQIYTPLIYRGPILISEVIRLFNEHEDKHKHRYISRKNNNNN